MKSKILTPVFAGMILISLARCSGPCTVGAGPPTKEERNVGEFSAIRSDVSANIILRDPLPGDNMTVKIKGQANILEHIKTKVEGNTLVISSEGCFSTTDEVVIFLSVNEISKITSSGSGNISSESPLRGDGMEIHLEGSGDANLEVKVNRTEIYVSGSGSATVRGNTNDVKAVSDGSGDIIACALLSLTTHATSNGSGNVEVHANRELTLELNGSGNMTYCGKAEKVIQEDNGSGEINQSDR